MNVSPPILWGGTIALEVDAARDFGCLGGVAERVSLETAPLVARRECFELLRVVLGSILNQGLPLAGWGKSGVIAPI